MAEQAASRLSPVVASPPMEWARGLLQRLIVPITLVLLWELSTRTNLLDSRFIPSPSKVLQAWYLWIFGSKSQVIDPYVGTWAAHSLASTERVFIGFLIAAFLGVLVGTVVGRFELGRALLDPVIQVLRPVPTTAWVPFAVLLFGLKAPSSIFLIALGSFFPVVVNTTDGVRMVPSIYYRAAAMLGTPPLRVLWNIVLPAALPSIFTGLRLGVGVAWVLVIVSEMVAVRSGLGYILWDAYYYARMDLIVAAMLTVGIFGYVSDRIVVLIANRLLRWHEGKL